MKPCIKSSSENKLKEAKLCRKFVFVCLFVFPFCYHTAKIKHNLHPGFPNRDSFTVAYGVPNSVCKLSFTVQWRFKCCLTSLSVLTKAHLGRIKKKARQPFLRYMSIDEFKGDFEWRRSSSKKQCVFKGHGGVLNQHSCWHCWLWGSKWAVTCRVHNKLCHDYCAETQNPPP